jgi:hypothetical protein
VILRASHLLGRPSTPWPTLSALFYVGSFHDWSYFCCLGWLQIVILLISASWLLGLLGMSHRHWAYFFFWLTWHFLFHVQSVFFFFWDRLLLYSPTMVSLPSSWVSFLSAGFTGIC